VQRPRAYLYSSLCRLYCNVFGAGVGTGSKVIAGKNWHAGGGAGGCSGGDTRHAVYTEYATFLFPRNAMVNHSCAPNCYWRSGLTLGDPACRGLAPAQQIATRGDGAGRVAAGEQLFITYTMLSDSGCAIGVRKRRQRLLAGFLFECACGRCRDELEELEVKAQAQRQRAAAPPKGGKGGGRGGRGGGRGAGPGGGGGGGGTNSQQSQQGRARARGR
jgi:hypothetical protein